MAAKLARDDRRLEACIQTDRSCRDCVQTSARQLTRISPTLNPASARAIFTTMYPAAECRRMAGTFLRTYQVEKAIARREPHADEGDVPVTVLAATA